MTRVLFFGTHPKQFNGYSKVVYEIAKCICKRDDIQLSIYGFQNFYDNAQHRKDMSDAVTVYDAFKNEEPKAMGFGVQQVREYVKEHSPDVCIVYNDMMVIHQVLTQLQLAIKEDGKRFKIIAYIDQVYLNQKKEFIEFVNQNADFGLLFTQYWEKIIVDQGLKLPTDHLVHGFNKMTYFPIPKNLARQYYGLKPDDFIVLNLNRNQPRKRWDICLKAFAEIVARHPNEPIKLMIATALQGAWNLVEIYERELNKRNVKLEDGMKHLIVIDNPQRITDDETNILYNVADIGINTCDGEGYGLCNFEQGGLGIPQIVPRIGGFMEYFDDSCAMLIDPKMAYYVDNTRDMVCGEALLCEYMDFVDAIETYYFNSELRLKHGKAARQKILESYGWETISNKLCDIVHKVCETGPYTKKRIEEDPKEAIKNEVRSLEDEIEKIDITTLAKIMPSSDAGGIPATKIIPESGVESSKVKKALELKKLKKVEKLKKQLQKLQH
jgi:glycosyltransferase involved in cell wall biosynthesis